MQCQTHADRIYGEFQQRLPPSRRERHPLSVDVGAGKGKHSDDAASTVGSSPDDTPLDEKKLGLPVDEPSGATTPAVQPAYVLGDAEAQPEDAVRRERQHLDQLEGARQREEGAVIDAMSGLAATGGTLALLPDEEQPSLPRLVATQADTTEPATPVDDIDEKAVASSGSTLAAPAMESKKAAVSEKEKDKDGLDPELVKKYGKKKAEKIQNGRYAVEDGKVYDQSLVWALYKANMIIWWKSFTFMLLGAALQTCAPLITRQLIAQMTLAYDHHRDPTKPPAKSVGYGIGLAVALFVMEEAGSICNYQAQQRGAVMGFTMRAALIDLISRKSM